MVKRLKLNEKSLRDAEPKPGVSYQIFDTEVIGFAARVQASGARTFTIDYRHAGRQRRMTIGRWPEWSVTAARERAKELRRAIDEGQDPLAARDDWRGAPHVTDMIDRYIAEHLPKLAKTNAGDQVSMLKKMVEPAWGNRLVTEITKSDVAKFLDFVAEGRPRPSKAKPNNRARKLQGHKPTPIRANRMGEVLRKMFTLAMEWEWRTDNPAQGFHRRIEHARERFLSPEELTRLAAVLDAAEDQRAAAIIRMCMLTGARVGEVRTARFEQFNLDYAIWSKPASTTKQRKIHRVPISQDVAAIVRLRLRAVPSGNPWLFPGDTVGQRSARRTSGCGSSSWPTPMSLHPGTVRYNPAGNSDFTRKAEALALGIAKALPNHWPTPAAQNWKGSSEASITRTDGKSRMDLLHYRAEQGFSRPAPATWPDGLRSSHHAPISRPLWASMIASHGRAVSRRILKGRSRRRLNPLFVGWLMGWPIGHALCDCSATEFTLWQQHMRGALSQLPMASGPWIWRPTDAAQRPAQMDFLEGLLP